MPIRHRVCGVLLALAVCGSTFAQDDDGKFVRRDVPYVPTPTTVVPEMLKLADVKSTDKVYDLGCGDGRIVIAAAKERGATGVGVDLDPMRIKECHENAKKAGVEDKVKFLQQDLFLCDFHDASVVMLYLMPSINLKLRPKLFRELKPGTRVVSHHFDMGDWQPDQKVMLPHGGQLLFLWIMPGQVAGQWDANLTGPTGQPVKAVLNLQQQFQKVSGSADIDGHRYALVDGRLRGDVLTFGLQMRANPIAPPVQFTCRMMPDAPRTAASTDDEAAAARAQPPAATRPAPVRR